MSIQWRDPLLLAKGMTDSGHPTPIGIIKDHEHAMETKSGRGFVGVFDHIWMYCEERLVQR